MHKISSKIHTHLHNLKSIKGIKTILSTNLLLLFCFVSKLRPNFVHKINSCTHRIQFFSADGHGRPWLEEEAGKQPEPAAEPPLPGGLLFRQGQEAEDVAREAAKLAGGDPTLRRRRHRKDVPEAVVQKGDAPSKLVED
jgi:hypothetical protein